MIKYALIGCGAWGKNYISTIEKRPDLHKIAAICSRSPNSYKNYHHFSDYRDLRKFDVDAVIVATPPSSHYEIVRFALLSNKHVIVEKPFVFDVKQAEELTAIANERRLSLIINYIHLFNTEFLALRENFKFNSVPIQTLSIGQNWGPFRTDYSALWDYGSHDIAMVLYFAGYNEPIKIDCMAKSPGNNGLYSINLQFQNGISSWINVGNMSPVKTRMFAAKSLRETAVWQDDGKQNPLDNLVETFSKYLESNLQVNYGTLGIQVTKILQICDGLITLG